MSANTFQTYCRSQTSSRGTVVEDGHSICDSAGITSGQIAERLGGLASLSPQAAMQIAFSGDATLLAATFPVAAPATIFKTFTELDGSYIGFYNIPSGGRGDMRGGCLAFRIKGSSASMYCFGGDSTPYRVLVDSDTLASRTTPTLAGGKIPLFSGLSDTWHTVFVWQDNSGTGQGMAITGNFIEAYGSSAQALPMGAAYYLTDPAFPGVSTMQYQAHALNPAAIKDTAGSALSGSTGWSARPVGSVHFRGRYEKLYVTADVTATTVMVSINGALAASYALDAGDANVNNTTAWRKIVGLPDSSSSYSEIIISGAGSQSVTTMTTPILGLMAYGSTASIIAPTATKRHVAILGASQVEGVVVGATGYRTDMHLAQNRLSIYTTSNGLAGGVITALTTALPTIGPKFQVRDICLLSVGINSADDVNFQPDYQALITACLTAGFTKVICRGLCIQAASVTSKNAKIAAAVIAIANPAVVFADTSTWVATLDGAGGTIAMPDGVHPSGAGYETMADFVVRDHAALFS